MWKKAKNIFSFQKIFAEIFERLSEIFMIFLVFWPRRKNLARDLRNSDAAEKNAVKIVKNGSKTAEIWPSEVRREFGQAKNES